MLAVRTTIVLTDIGVDNTLKMWKRIFTEMVSTLSNGIDLFRVQPLLQLLLLQALKVTTASWICSELAAFQSLMTLPMLNRPFFSHFVFAISAVGKLKTAEMYIYSPVIIYRGPKCTFRDQ